MPIPTKLLNQKSALLVDATDDFREDIDSLEAGIIRTIILPLINRLETNEGRLVPSARNYGIVAEVRFLVNRVIIGDEHQKSVRQFLGSLDNAYLIGTEASLKMDAEFSVNPETQVILNQFKSKIITAMSPEILGEKISRTATDRMVLAISIRGTKEDLIETFNDG